MMVPADDNDDLGWFSLQTTTLKTRSTHSPERIQQRSHKVKRAYGTRSSRNNDYVPPRVNTMERKERLFGMQGFDDGDETLDSSQSSFYAGLGYERTISDSLSSYPSTSTVGSSSINHATEEPNGIPSTARRNVPPLRPSKQQHRRSVSSYTTLPDIPKPHRLKRTSSSSHEGKESTKSDSFLYRYKENARPEFSEIGELQGHGPPNIRQQRKLVQGRRNSMSAACSPHQVGMRKSESASVLSQSSHSMSSYPRKANSTQLCRRNSISAFPCAKSTDVTPQALATRLNSENSSYSPTARTFDSGDVVDAGVSPGAHSFAASMGGSSRKRGMSDDPSEGTDDGSSNGVYSVPRTSFANNSASRSCAARRYSPACDDDYENRPMASFVPFESQFNGSDGRFRKGGGVMDIDSSDDDVSLDKSFSDESEDSDVEPAPSKGDSDNLRSPVLIVRTDEAVLASMSSEKDLQFLIKELRDFKLKTGRNKKSSFGTFQSHLTGEWSPDHRSQYIYWAGKRLGFCVKYVGPGRTYLEMKKAQALSKLELLESAWKLHRTRERGKPASCATDGNVNGRKPILLDTVSNLGTSLGNPPRAPVHDISIRQPESDETESLLAHLGSLSLMESNPTATLARLVTLDNKRPSSLSSAFKPDDSRDKCRLSLESHASTEVDFTRFYRHGLSPAPPERRSKRQQKLSLCVNSLKLNHRQLEGTPMNTGTVSSSAAGQQTSFDFVTTPLMKQACQAWGSRPIAGMDWGCSERCDASLLARLSSKLHVFLAEADHVDSSESALDGIFPVERSANVCLDLDVEGCSDDEDGYEDSDADSLPAMITKEMAMTSIHVRENAASEGSIREERRRSTALAKYKRMSVCALAPSSAVHRRTSLCLSKVGPEALQRDLSTSMNSFVSPLAGQKSMDKQHPIINIVEAKYILPHIFSFLEGSELLTTVPLVCSAWSDSATEAYANLMLASVGCPLIGTDGYHFDGEGVDARTSVADSMERSWSYLIKAFPHASFLGQGGLKRVYKVKNAAVKVPEAVSVMDIDDLDSNELTRLGTELSVTVMLSSLARRGICPNFVVTRDVFTCPFEPPETHWGSADRRNEQVHVKIPKNQMRKPREPRGEHRGRYQYIRMELCTGGDAEEYIKDQPNGMLSVDLARSLLFQIAFALHAAASKVSLKHYDLKLLNVFLQEAANIPGAKPSATGDVVLRYGLGSKVFALTMPSENALIAKLADYGTCDVRPETTGQPVTINRFTTFENTPPEFLILGDNAKQGHNHDQFGLGLCMLHLFTGQAPYEELLNDVRCPSNFRKSLGALWEDESASGYTLIRTCIFDVVFKDDEGMYDGELDETLHNTLYKYLVLFGIPEHKFQRKEFGKVWKAICDSFCNDAKKPGKDLEQFKSDRRKYSLSHGTNKFIARARRNLEKTIGGMELLMSLVTFDPDMRATALEVLNSDFFAPLTEVPSARYRACDDVHSYTAFSTS